MIATQECHSTMCSGSPHSEPVIALVAVSAKTADPYPVSKINSALTEDGTFSTVAKAARAGFCKLQSMDFVSNRSEFFGKMQEHMEAMDHRFPIGGGWLCDHDSRVREFFERSGGYVRRTKNPTDKKTYFCKFTQPNGNPGFFDERPRHGHTLDFDGKPSATALLAEHGIDVHKDPQHAIRTAVDLFMPVEIARATTLVQLSASAGKNGPSDIGFHVSFWLDRPIHPEHLRKWFKHHQAKLHEGGIVEQGENVIDAATLTANQIIHTSVRFKETQDPISERVFTLEGAGDVDTSSIEVVEKKSGGKVDRRTAIKGKNGKVTDLTNQMAMPSSWRGTLSLLGDGSGCQGFHRVLRSVAFKREREAILTGQPVDRNAFVTTLQQAIDASDQSAHDPDYIISRRDHDYLYDLLVSGHVAASRLLESNRIAQQPHQVPHVAKTNQQQATEQVTVEVNRFFEQARRYWILEDAGRTRSNADGTGHIINLADRRPVHTIAAKVGLGKTHAAIHALLDVDLKANRVVFVVPTYSKAHELARDYHAAVSAAGIDHPDATVLYGQGYSGENIAGKHFNACFLEGEDRDAAFLSGDRSSPITPAQFCGSCPLASTCFYKQQENDESAGLKIIVKSYLSANSIPSITSEENPHRLYAVVIDEAFADSMQADETFRLNGDFQSQAALRHSKAILSVQHIIERSHHRHRVDLTMLRFLFNDILPFTKEQKKEAKRITREMRRLENEIANCQKRIAAHENGVAQYKSKIDKQGGQLSVVTENGDIATPPGLGEEERKRVAAITARIGDERRAVAALTGTIDDLRESLPRVLKVSEWLRDELRSYGSATWEAASELMINRSPMEINVDASAFHEHRYALMLKQLVQLLTFEANSLRIDSVASVTVRNGIVRMRWNRQLPDKLAWLPILHLNATAQESHSRLLFGVNHVGQTHNPPADLKFTQIDASNEFATFVKVLRSPFTMQKLTKFGADQQSVAMSPSRLSRNHPLEQLLLLVKALGQRVDPNDNGSPSVGVFLPKDARTYIERYGELDRRYGFGHHGAVQGLNSWRNAKLVLSFGRPMAPSRAFAIGGGLTIEDDAQAFRALDPCGSVIDETAGIEKVTTAIKIAGGQAINVLLEGSSDPYLDAFYKQGAAAAVIQSLGRGRDVWCNKDRQCLFLDFSDVPTSFEYDRVVTMDAFANLNEMTAIAHSEGIVSPRVSDWERISAGIFSSSESARNASKRDLKPSLDALTELGHHLSSGTSKAMTHFCMAHAAPDLFQTNSYNTFHSTEKPIPLLDPLEMSLVILHRKRAKAMPYLLDLSRYPSVDAISDKIGLEITKIETVALD